MQEVYSVMWLTLILEMDAGQWKFDFLQIEPVSWREVYQGKVGDELRIYTKIPKYSLMGS